MKGSNKNKINKIKCSEPFNDVYIQYTYMHANAYLISAHKSVKPNRYYASIVYIKFAVNIHNIIVTAKKAGEKN